MPATNPAVPSLPPILRRLIRPLPLAPLQPLPGFFLQRIARRHPGVFERLGHHAGKRFGIAPTDLPFAFVLEPRPRRPTITAVRQLPARLDVRIAGPLAGLIGLVDGRFDGDAMFFSRDLKVEGDVEALLALRNAVDDAEIDLTAEFLTPLGPLGRPAERFLRGLTQPADHPRRMRGAAPWN